MKKIYVFLNRRICGIDGSIQYIHNKSAFLKDKGYDVLVYSTVPGKIYVKDFEKYQKTIIPNMRFCPSVFRKSEREKTLKYALSFLENKYDDVLIESTNPVSAVWGELMARRLRCRHLYFHLMEVTRLRQDFRDFCRFKYQRGELAGIANETVPRLLADEQVEPVRISAHCQNVFEECEDPFSGQLNPEADYTIGSIGRLEKPYVLPMTDALVRFFKKNENLNFNFVLIGGAGDGIKGNKYVGEIAKRLRDCKNVNLVVTGYLYPIPLSLVRNIDIFVSAAGSSNGTYRLGKPTIRLNPLTGAPAGILGCDFARRSGSLYSSSDSLTIEDCVTRIIEKKADITYEDFFDEKYEKHINESFTQQLEMALSDSTPEYYDEEKLNRIKTPFKKYHTAYSAFCHVFGGDALRKMMGLADFLRVK